MQLSQTSYINQALDQFSLNECGSFKTTVASNVYDELKHQHDDPIVERVSCQNMIGSLL